MATPEGVLGMPNQPMVLRTTGAALKQNQTQKKDEIQHEHQSISSGYKHTYKEKPYKPQRALAASIVGDSAWVWTLRRNGRRVSEST